MTIRRQLTLAIDCGSTNFKVALFDAGLSRLAEAAAPVTYRPGRPAVVEFDVEPWWQAAVELIRSVCAQADVSDGAITHLSVTSQAQTFTIIETQAEAPGKFTTIPSPALIPFISWMDKRAVAEAAALQEKFGREFHRHSSFWKCIPQLQLAKLIWVRRQFAIVPSADQRVIALPTLLMLRLAGLNVIDRNAAAMSGLYSLHDGDWWNAAVQETGWQPDQLSTLVDVGAAVTADHVSEPVFSRELRVISAGNDQTAGAYGVGLRDDGVVLTLGTALVAYRHAGMNRGPYHPGGIWGPYPGGGYYELATRDEGCAALDWAIERLAPGTGPDAFREIGQRAAPGSAWFFPQRMGSAEAWTGATDLPARARAVIEGISFSARQLITEDLGETQGKNPIQVIGGGAQSALWLQLLADVLNCPVQRGSGEPLLGAAMMACGLNDPRRNESKIFQPNPSQATLYDRLFRQWSQSL